MFLNHIYLKIYMNITVMIKFSAAFQRVKQNVIPRNAFKFQKLHFTKKKFFGFVLGFISAQLQLHAQDIFAIRHGKSQLYHIKQAKLHKKLGYTNKRILPTKLSLDPQTNYEIIKKYTERIGSPQRIRKIHQKRELYL